MNQQCINTHKHHTQCDSTNLSNSVRGRDLYTETISQASAPVQPLCRNLGHVCYMYSFSYIYYCILYTEFLYFYILFLY